jgi:hypothetical protein
LPWCGQALIGEPASLLAVIVEEESYGSWLNFGVGVKMPFFDLGYAA